MPFHCWSRSTVASNRPECRRRRLPSHFKSCRSNMGWLLSFGIGEKRQAAGAGRVFWGWRERGAPRVAGRALESLCLFRLFSRLAQSGVIVACAILSRVAMLSSRSATSIRWTFALKASVTAASTWPRQVAAACSLVGGALAFVLVPNIAVPLSCRRCRRAAVPDIRHRMGGRKSTCSAASALAWRAGKRDGPIAGRCRGRGSRWLAGDSNRNPAAKGRVWRVPPQLLNTIG